MGEASGGMTPRPILFSAPMVRALLDGSKTQTRRLATNKAAARIEVGDRLWVRETCRAQEIVRSGQDGVLYAADDVFQPIEAREAAAAAWLALFYYRGRGVGMLGNSVPAIHMPRWVSRLTLVVTEVRRQRLQDISEADAIAEGCSLGAPGGPNLARGLYSILWDAINGPDSWDKNPEVIAVTFTVHRFNISRMPA